MKHDARPIPPDAPPAATWLGLAGAIPFVALALAAIAGQDMVLGLATMPALIGYGAVILSFLGGIRWGLAMPDPRGAAQAAGLVQSVLPSLLAWAALLAPPTAGLVMLCLGFVAQGVADRAFGSPLAPAWFARLRTLLTAIVAVSLLAAIAARIV
jgi:hypothetical protein